MAFETTDNELLTRSPDGLPHRPPSTKGLRALSANRIQHRARPISVSNWRW
jgi:hypothetical protein